MLYLILYLKILPCYRQYSWKRFASKLWKSYSWLHLKIHPEMYWWVTSEIIRCYRGPTLNNAFGFYRFTSRCNSLALVYVTKDFEWSDSVWLWKIRQFLLHSCIGNLRLALTTHRVNCFAGILEWGISLKSFWHVISSVVAYQLPARKYFCVILFTLITSDIRQS